MGRAIIPPDIREKEKIIGGVFTVSQVVLMAIGFVLALICMSLLYNLLHNVIVALFGAGAAIPFVYVALKKVHLYGDMEYSQYLILKHRYNKSRKKFPNINENYRK